MTTIQILVKCIFTLNGKKAIDFFEANTISMYLYIFIIET